MKVAWDKLEEVFLSALEHEPEQHQAYLDVACDGDAVLRAEVESLLASHEQARDFIEAPAVAFVSDLLTGELIDDASKSTVGQRIGQYKVIQEIGRGGMGTVYLAARADEQYQKLVAIKVVRRGMDSEDILRRFRNERQILASLEHPNIARLLDGGTTDDGLPYLVMEYVEGTPVTNYSDDQRLPTNERLQIFRTICAAVQHAHQNLVVHRDLKPSNILITPDGRPKLLDFGIAKVLNPALVGPAMERTGTELRVLTPDYASPEQVRGKKLTTTSDIYSLGVVLYELLTGHRPYRSTNTPSHDLARVICEQEPPKPSTAVSSVEVVTHDDSRPQTTITPESVSRARDTQFDKLRRGLFGDLDNIVLMALRKEPERRYESAAQLSTDIQRHLDGLPVIARKDTFKYRASKFIGRNKIAVAAACLLVFTLLGGIIATTWEARKARAQARIANAKSAEAQQALRRTEKISGFLQSVFSYANPHWFGRAGGRENMTVAEAMRDVEKRIDTEFADDLGIRGDLRQQIGDTYRTQGLWTDAERNLREALRLRLELYGEDNAKVAETMYILSAVRAYQGDALELERLMTRALEIQRRHPNDGNDLPYMVRDYAAFLFDKKGQFAAALALDLEALELFRTRYGENHYMVVATRASLARDYFVLGDYSNSEAQIQEVLRTRKQSEAFANSLDYLARIQIIRGDYQAAEITIKQKTLPEEKPDSSRQQMAMIYTTQSFMAYRQRDYTESKTFAEKALAAWRYSESTDRLAGSLNKLGQARRAESLVRAQIEGVKKSTADNLMTLGFLNSVLGESLTAQHRFAEAETFLLAAYETQKAQVLPQEYRLIETRKRLAELYRAWGKTDEAKTYE